MKKVLYYVMFVSLILLSSVLLASEKSNLVVYEPNWESLKKHPIPEWVKDAKFGVYTHWGIYSIPAYKSNTYVRNMYAPSYELDVTGTRRYHEKNYGPLDKFGYKDFIPMFKAEKFDAAEWVQIMKDAGAKFGGICLVHHDGFCLWDSKYTRWNSKNMGPKRDIYGEIAREIRKAGLKLLATFHHARTYGFAFGWPLDLYTEEQKKTWDLFDPRYKDFYRNPEIVTKEEFGNEWANKIQEVVRKYKPDILWFDGLRNPLKNKVIPEDRMLEIFAEYFNTALAEGRDVVICNKLPAGKHWNFPVGFGLRCYENTRDMEAHPLGTWLIDRAISYPWTYVRNKKYNLTYQYHISSLVDIVSRGGIFLISLTPKGDGSIPDEEKFIMRKIGEWLRVNGEAIYSTRPWKIPGEGTPVEKMIIKKADGKTTWNYDLIVENGKDVRFTRRGNTLYAIVLGWPKSGVINIKSLAKGNVEKHGRGIKNVTMLGCDEKIYWKQDEKSFFIKFPSKKPCEVAYSFKIEVNGELDVTKPPINDGVKRVNDFPVFE